MITIKIPFTSDINNLVAYGKEQSKNFEGTFEGNVKEGKFDFKAPAGSFAGEYRVYGRKIEIILKNKPVYLPAFVIEQFLKRYIK